MGVNGDEEFDDDGRDDEEASDGEFPGVGGRDGTGNDDGSCSDGRGSEEDVPRENLFCRTLSLSKLTTTKSWNKSLRMSSFILRLFFLFCLHIFAHNV